MEDYKITAEEIERLERKAFLKGDIDLVIIIDSFEFEDELPTEKDPNT